MKRIEDSIRYSWLKKPEDRWVTALMVAIVMVVVGACLSVVLPVWAVLTVIFAPAVVTGFFGQYLIPKDEFTGLSTNQRLAIERYRSADEATKKLFPEGFEQTVRNATDTNGQKGYGDNDQYKLAVAAQRILDASKARNDALKVGDDAVIVALQMMTENADMGG